MTINPLSPVTWMVTASAGSPYAWSYDAVSGSIKRAAPTGINRSEDSELTSPQRAQLLSATRDLHRNFALLGWAIRKHTDYVASFTFQAKSPDDNANERLEEYVRQWSEPESFDAAGRHDMDTFMRIAELRCMLDGDIFTYKLDDGRVQAVEGELIRNPNGSRASSYFSLPAPQDLVHGVEVNEFNRAIRFAYHRRIRSLSGEDSARYQFVGMIPAEFVYQMGIYDRFDQVRGISPLAPAINSLRDLYESFDYALAKMKLSQLLGLIFYREGSDPIGEPVQVTESGATEETSIQPKYKVDFGRNTFKLELDAGDRAEFLESRNPSSEFQSFALTQIALVLKAFDIPYSFYAENFSNYSGSRQALLQYEQSAENHRRRNRRMRNHLTAWRIQKGIEQGHPLLRGIHPESIKWEWVGSQLPWIDPVKEATANATSVDRGFTSVPAVCKAQGADAWEIAKEQANFEARVKDYREKLGLPGILTSTPISYTEVINGSAA